jgi:hypothetical protein
MPRLPKPTYKSVEDRVAASVLEDMEQIAARIAAEEGDAPGSRTVGDAELVKLWGTTDPRADPDILRERLATTGLGDEAQQMKIAEEWPELVELYAQPVADPEILEQLVALAQYPYRRSVYEDIDDPEEQVKEAERIAALWQKTQPALPEPPMAPAPVEPMQPQPAPAPVPAMGG